MIAKTAVNKPVTILIIFSLIVGIGAYVATELDIDLYPEFEPPVVLVYTSYSGAGPEQVEDRVTRNLEGQLANVSNLKQMSSTSKKDVSLVILEFEWGEDLTEASNEIRDKIELVKSYLPDEVENPQILKFDPSSQPIMYFSLSGTRTEQELYDLADDVILPKFEQIDGVSMASLKGARKPIVRVEVKQNRLDAFGLTLTGAANGITTKLYMQNVNTSGGEIDEGNMTYIVKTGGEYQSIQEIKETVLTTTASGKMVRVEDLADVFLGFEEEDSIFKIDGNRSMEISIQKQSGGNSVEVANNVIKRYNSLVDELPAGVNLTLLYDTTTFIRNTISEVISSLFSGMALAMIILFLFLRSFKSTLIIGLSIPISLLITLGCMYFAGLTLNILSLTGLVLGIGMIVDSSIVILENIFRYREKGAKHESAAILGSSEMIGAITGSTLTTVCVFLPLVLFKQSLGIIGVMTRDLAFTIIIALLSSLFVAITLVPVLSSKYLRLYTTQQRPLKNRYLAIADNFLKNVLDNLDIAYKKLLTIVLDKKAITLSIIAGIFLVSLFAFKFLGLDLMPPSQDDSVTLSMELPVGTRLEKTLNLVEDFEKILIDEVSAYKSISVTAGAGNFFSSGGSHTGRVQIYLPTQNLRVETSDDVKEILRKHFVHYPDVSFKFSGGRGMGGSSSPIDVMIKCDDLDKARATGFQVLDLIKTYVPNAVEPSLDMKNGLPQAELFIDRQKAYNLGVDMTSIGKEITASIDSAMAGYYRIYGKEYEIRVIFREEDKSNILDLDRITVSTSKGTKIPVSNFAEVKITEGPLTISRLDQTRIVHVTASLPKGLAVSEVQSQISSVLDKHLVKDDTVSISYGGDYEDLQELGSKLIAVMLIAIFLVFGIMASQFEDLLDPFIIFISMFTLIIGVVWIYIITGQNLSTFSLVGIVMLVGIVVNNGIVLVDYSNLLRDRGFSIREACIEAGGNRLRPVLMTSLTTILGMLPMAISSGEGSDMVQPIGLTVLGGMVVNTFMTLILVPVLWYLFNNRKKKS